jgi:hypothetical protein
VTLATVAELPALPLHTAGKYVAGAYIVLFALVLIYVAIMALRLSRVERDLGELLEQLERDERAAQAPPAAVRTAHTEGEQGRAEPPLAYPVEAHSQARGTGK